MEIIDSHSHLFLEEYTDDLSVVIERARLAGVSHIFMPNIDQTTIEPLLNVCNQYKDYCFPLIGLHPTSVNESYENELNVIKERLENPNSFIGIGEIGLDLYWDKTFLEQQIVSFRQQVIWAIKYHLPIVIHSREAFPYIYKVLEPYKETALRGIFHSFTGTKEDALQLMEFEHFVFGINGVVTFKNSTLKEALEIIPIDRIVLETDSPYLAPVPNRGKRNESANLKYILIKVAEIYKMSPQEVAEITSRNTLKMFGMIK
ncbi:MAG: TatD family hydrolase [Bacteroides sp.]